MTRFSTPRVFGRFCLALAVAASLAFGDTFNARAEAIYVAPNGNDAWTGRLDRPAAGTQDGPLATISRALAAARSARSNGAVGVSIEVRAGVYELRDPLVVKPEDSGPDAAHPLVIEAFPGEKPVVSGGRRISGWRSSRSNRDLWEADVPEAAGGKWVFRELFVNGKRAQRARTPRSGFYRVDGESPNGHPARFHFKPGDIRPEWALDSGVEVVMLLSWAELRMQIRGVDESNRIATLSGVASQSNREKNARYYIENAPAGVDAPGEWRLDSKTGRVTYWALPGENPNEADVRAPILTEIIRFEGDMKNRIPVGNVIVRGLEFAESNWTLGEKGDADPQAAVEIHGAFRADGAVNCAIEKCVFARLGGYALDFGRACQGVKIARNEIYDVGAGGIRLGEPEERSGFDATSGNIIEDNVIHAIGRVYPAGVGVIVFQSSDNRILHNDIHDTYYTAISVGWHWGYGDPGCRSNIIDGNHLYNIGQGMLSDMGGVYTLGPQPGAILRGNLIHDVNCAVYGGWGIYPDEGSTGLLIENNIVARASSAGFHQHYGKENVVRNNIFAFGRDYQLMRTRAEDHLSFIFESNIIYYDSGGLFGGNWSGDAARVAMTKNLYFDTRLATGANTMKFDSGELSQWQARGRDVDSLVADPMFVNAAKMDFRLRPGSPATRLGFKPIDLLDVGPRKE
jgi:hypothetical protein